MPPDLILKATMLAALLWTLSALNVQLNNPVVITAGPPGETRWGRYQFPTLHRLADGRLLAFVHVEADSATAYGAPKKTFVSSDNGAHWQEDPAAANNAYGLKLDNGDWLRIDTTPSLEAAPLNLPEPLGHTEIYNVDYALYPLRRLARDLRLIFFQRFTGGQWQKESTALDDKHGARYTVQGRFPRIWWGDLRQARDGSLLAVTYPTIPDKAPYTFGSAAYRSTDRGRSWRLRGRIPHTMDTRADPQAAKRAGFSEPAFDILPNGDLYAVLRTTDGHGIGPMYETRSRDQGKTWTRPTVFAKNGVMPRLLRLDNGVLVLASGRPGVQLRVSRKGNGTDWTEPLDLIDNIDAARPQADTCGYTDLVALNRDEFLIVYSWFKYESDKGAPRKAILARRIRVTP